MDGLHLMRRDIDLWPLAQQLIQDLQAVTTAAQIKIHNLIPRQLTAHADAGLIARVLQNLVANSIKFAPGGEINIGARETKNGVECWIHDNGGGIAPERLKLVFEKFETDTDATRAGFGLGLTIVKKIVESHGGEISVTSQPGEGTTFRFTLPPPPAPA